MTRTTTAATTATTTTATSVRVKFAKALKPSGLVVVIDEPLN